MESVKITGLIAAPFTPFDDKGEVDHSLFKKYADFLADTHFEYVFVNGTLAEGMSLTVAERKATAKAWVNCGKERLKVIVHVGTNCLKDSQELAKHAEEIGAFAIAALTPSYHKPENEDCLVEYMAQLAAVAPNTPFYYYDINFATGVYINCSKFLKLAKERIPTLCGLKHSSREMPSAHGCTLVEEGKYQVLFGTDVQYLSCLVLGMSEVVAAPVLGNLFHNIKKAFDNGDLETARSLQCKAQRLNEIKEKHGGGINIAKSMFTILSGLEMGSVRLPLRGLTPDEKKRLETDLETAGFLDLAKPK
ncbi:hypothetical protein CHS0354_028818 [Potamilus streckersoni]|uniref:N-acetylneuraminate lyase n=2 Tax=Potamilus streckersoni TaxID=2493646 RepID=A0AAE0RY01_9BIVA|nr:hypothetical protein CHS0354_028818 [Potamilus streckersoni]